MSKIPVFADIPFQTAAGAQGIAAGEPWLTPEGILVKPG